MGPLGLFLLLAVALIAICIVVIRKTTGQQQITDIDQDGPVNSSSNLYRSRSYYSSSSATSDVLSGILGASSSSSTYNGDDRSSVATATQVDDSPASNDGCSDDGSDGSSDCSSGSNSGSDGGSSSDSGSSDS